ncbi:MAG: hypothetical protein JWL74_591 [Alphaproteobacteria bacterium]|nr:hypothetical protein [Alphaproteobacteria bacterium]
MRGASVVTLSGLALLAGCGEHFPVGERLWPGSYGPPYGRDMYRPHHSEHVASGERHAAFVAEESRSYRSHEACNAAMRTLLAEPGGERHGPVTISPLETVGHHSAGGVTHEYRCSGDKLSQRAWRSGEDHGEGHAPAH